MYVITVPTCLFTFYIVIVAMYLICIFIFVTFSIVEYNDSKSETKSISIGVPQGSIWDLYFSLYTLMIYLGSVVSSVC